MVHFIVSKLSLNKIDLFIQLICFCYLQVFCMVLGREGTPSCVGCSLNKGTWPSGQERPKSSPCLAQHDRYPVRVLDFSEEEAAFSISEEVLYVYGFLEAWF